MQGVVTMAPYIGPSREQVLRWLRSANPASRLPITLGVYAPQAIIDRDDKRWILCPLELDDEAARKAGEEARSNGEPWMPEMQWDFLEKSAPLVAAETIHDFVEALESLEWCWDVPGAE